MGGRVSLWTPLELPPARPCNALPPSVGGEPTCPPNEFPANPLGGQLFRHNSLPHGILASEKKLPAMETWRSGSWKPGDPEAKGLVFCSFDANIYLIICYGIAEKTKECRSPGEVPAKGSDVRTLNLVRNSPPPSSCVRARDHPFMPDTA